MCSKAKGSMSWSKRAQAIANRVLLLPNQGPDLVVVDAAGVLVSGLQVGQPARRRGVEIALPLDEVALEEIPQSPAHRVLDGGLGAEGRASRQVVAPFLDESSRTGRTVIRHDGEQLDEPFSFVDGSLAFTARLLQEVPAGRRELENAIVVRA